MSPGLVADFLPALAFARNFDTVRLERQAVHVDHGPVFIETVIVTHDYLLDK